MDSLVYIHSIGYEFNDKSKFQPIADKVIDHEFSQIERDIYIIDIEEAFDVDDDWMDDPEFEKKFCSLSRIKKVP